MGQSITLHSTDMPGAPKAKVFFDPNKAVDGNAPAVGKPPAWFVFWQQGAVPDLVGFEYDHTLTGYGRSTAPDSLWIGPSASGVHYPGGYVINGISFGGASGIDSVAEVTSHERFHNTYVNEINAGAADTDGDLIADHREAALGLTVGNPDTFSLATIKAPVYATYWRWRVRSHGCV